jgi:outer membrane biosynthesis protein TonB
MPAKKKPATKKAPAAKKPAVAKKKTSMKKAPTKKKATARKPATSRSGTTARPGDLLVIDSAKVGSPPREGEVLEIIQGEVSISYRVQWPDGHQSVIAPVLGSARIVPAIGRA